MNIANKNNIPKERQFCAYLEDKGICNILLREQNLIKREISTVCNGWCMSAIGEKEFQRMVRDISGRKI